MTDRSQLSEWLTNPARFVKMHGSGNDFVLIDLRESSIPDSELPHLAVTLCSRHTGVGADGLIGIGHAHPSLQGDEPNSDPVTLEMKFKNPDGSDAGMCGNGARCFAALVSVLGGSSSISFLMGGQTYHAMVFEDGSDPGIAEPLPSMAEIEFPGEMRVEQRTVEEVDLMIVYSGTEHIVVRTDPSRLDNPTHLRERGSYWRNHPAFAPLGTNVNFLASIPAANPAIPPTQDTAMNSAKNVSVRSRIPGVSHRSCTVRTFERGVEDLTLSCGTGAIASALAWHANERTNGYESSNKHTTDHRSGKTQLSSRQSNNDRSADSLQERELESEQEFRIQVHQPGGTVEVIFLFDERTNTYRRIRLKGPVAFVFMAQNFLHPHSSSTDSSGDHPSDDHPSGGPSSHTHSPL